MLTPPALPPSVQLFGRLMLAVAAELFTKAAEVGIKLLLLLLINVLWACVEPLAELVNSKAFFLDSLYYSYSTCIYKRD